jgi:hypothetical protein
LISESNSRHAREAYGTSTPIRRGRPLRCARAASGIAIDALPGPAMNSRRRFVDTSPWISDPCDTGDRNSVVIGDGVYHLEGAGLKIDQLIWI